MRSCHLRISDAVIEWTDAVHSIEEARSPGGDSTFPTASECEQIADWVARQRRAFNPVTLVIPSSWCLIHPVNPSVRRPDHTTLCYEFEAAIPWPAERVTAEFMRMSGAHYLGIAVRTDDVGPLINVLANNGIFVERITLDVLDAVSETVIGAASRLLWCDTRHLTMLELNGDRISELRCVRVRSVERVEEYEELVDCLNILAVEGKTELPLAIAGRIHQDWLERLRARFGGQRGGTHKTGSTPAIISFNLARDALRPQRMHSAVLRSVRRCAAAALIASVALLISCMVQISRMRAELETMTRWEQAQFRQMFPNQPIPSGIALRMASERRRLESLTGGGSSQTIEHFDAMASLAQFVGAIPSTLKLDVDELRVSSRGFTLRGRTLDHRAGEQLAASFSEIPSVTCAAPRTERQTDSTVRFALNAQSVSKKPENTARRAKRTNVKD